MKTDSTIIVSAMEIEQSERQFYLFKIKATDLLSIAYFNPREIDRESGIQRPFKESRSKEIAEYIDSDDSVLPNNIIVSLDSRYISFSNGSLHILQEEIVSEFSPKEFTGKYSITSLCSALKNDGVSIESDTLANLNNLLKLPDLYDQVLGKKHKSPTKWLFILRQSYEKSKEENILKRINRSILEEFYSQETPKSQKIAFIIDGQHRLRAFKYVTKNDFELPVSAFIDLSLAEVAEIFVKINYNQKPVSKSLVYDLLGISDDIFPEFVEAHKITEILNETIGSPWFDNIKMLGIGKGIITQASFITALEANKILTDLLRDYSLEQKASILSNYFTAIKQLFPGQWGHKGSIIAKTLGLNAFVRILPRIFKQIVQETKGFKVKDIKNLLLPITKIDFDAEEISSLGGIKGVKKLAQILDNKLL